MPVTLGAQIVWLLVLSVPVACITWTVTHEELFRAPREWAARHHQTATSFFGRRFFYMCTCEYCFSHYVSLLFLVITRYHLLFQDGRGYLVAFFSLPWIANLYIAFYGRGKLGVTRDRVEIKAMERHVEKETATNHPQRQKPAA